MNLAQLLRRSAHVAAGLSRSELAEVELLYDVTFAPDHRALLAEVLPLGEGWPDWRYGDEDQLRDLVTMPRREQREAAERGRLWLDSWGLRPDDPQQAARIAEGHVLAAPVLAPLHNWRYVPSEPAGKGNPVFSYYYDDTIVIAENITAYLEQLAGDRVSARLPDNARTVPFWTELTQLHARPFGE